MWKRLYVRNGTWYVATPQHTHFTCCTDRRKICKQKSFDCLCVCVCCGVTGTPCSCNCAWETNEVHTHKHIDTTRSKRWMVHTIMNYGLIKTTLKSSFIKTANETSIRMILPSINTQSISRICMFAMQNVLVDRRGISLSTWNENKDVIITYLLHDPIHAQSSHRHMKYCSTRLDMIYGALHQNHFTNTKLKCFPSLSLSFSLSL